MYWSNLLHFYQPFNQQPDILEEIVNQSYRPLLKGILRHPEARLTINISGSLLELFEKYDYLDLIAILQELGRSGRGEFTGTAKYHAFLPLLPEEEIRHQIEANNIVSKRILGDMYQPKGFFIPELSFSKNVAGIVKEMGFSWIVAPELAFYPGKPERDRIYKDPESGLSVFFRNKRTSVLILAAICRTPQSLYEELTKELAGGSESYLVTIMDAETFGHHRPGLSELLFDLWKDFGEGNKNLVPVQISELPEFIKKEETANLREATWSNEEQDFWIDKEKAGTLEKSPFLLWRDPVNSIHTKQWEFTDWAIEKIREAGIFVGAHHDAPVVTTKRADWETARDLLDKALSSDQFWWASAKPWWSLEMIESGAYYMREAVLAIPEISDEDQKKADKFYNSIMEEAFRWQREGIVRKKHFEANPLTTKVPFKDRTPGYMFNRWILEFEDEMKKAAEDLEFEKAIKWRDAIIKLKEGTDIYDGVHAVDILWTARKIPSVKEFLDHREAEISEFAKKHMVDWEELKGKMKK